MHTRVLCCGYRAADNVSLILAQRGADLTASTIDTRLHEQFRTTSWIGYKEPSVRMGYDGCLTSETGMTKATIHSLVSSVIRTW